jgi:YHS domain-containing protein
MDIESEPAMGGYCPVTLRDKGAWVRGRYDNRAKIDDLVFFTAGPAEQEALVADPAKYMPALGGDCAVSYVDFGERVRGSTFHAAQYEGRYFFFLDAERKAAFKAQPQRYGSIDLAAGGACVVTLKDQGKTTPGLAEFAVWHEGLLYKFAGAAEKEKFLATPDLYAVEPPDPGAEPPVQPPLAPPAPAQPAPSQPPGAEPAEGEPTADQPPAPPSDGQSPEVPTTDGDAPAVESSDAPAVEALEGGSG